MRLRKFLHTQIFKGNFNYICNNIIGRHGKSCIHIVYVRILSDFRNLRNQVHQTFLYLQQRRTERQIPANNPISMNRFLNAAIIVATFLLYGCIKEKNQGADLKVGDALPTFSVTMNDGSTVSEQSLKENISLVMFFHTTCPDCQRTLPEVQRLYDEYKDSDTVRFVLISREQEASAIESYWTTNQLNMPYSAQTTREIYQLFASNRIPRIYISDRNGIIQHIYTDDPTPDYKELKSILEDYFQSQN